MNKAKSTPLLRAKVHLPNGDPKYFFAAFFYLLKQVSVEGSDVPENLKPYLEELLGENKDG